jgi:hypothetical protein
MSCTLIMTATITPPPGAPGLVRVDPALRMRDYLDALEFYLNVPDRYLSRIVFTDNSDSDITPLKELADRRHGGKEVWVTSHQGLDYEPYLGRGHGEMKLLDRIINEFEPIAKLPEETKIWKATGRYKLVNIGRLIDSAPRSYEVYCDLKDMPQHRFDMRFFSFTLAGYRRLFAGHYRDMAEYEMTETGPRFVVLPEVDMRELINHHLHEPGVFPRFRVEPWVDGLRGMDNASYINGRGMFKYLTRATTRKLAPRVWI